MRAEALCKLYKDFWNITQAAIRIFFGGFHKFAFCHFRKGGNPVNSSTWIPPYRLTGQAESQARNDRFMEVAFIDLAENFGGNNE